MVKIELALVERGRHLLAHVGPLEEELCVCVCVCVRERERERERENVFLWVCVRVRLRERNRASVHVHATIRNIPSKPAGQTTGQIGVKQAGATMDTIETTG